MFIIRAHSIIAITSVLVASGCYSGDRKETQSRLPSNKLMNQIEWSLSRFPCIGDTSSWDRLYYFSEKSHKIDKNVVEFVYRQAGAYEFRKGRRAVVPGEYVGPDDRHYKIAYGQLNIQERTVTLSACGMNA